MAWSDPLIQEADPNINKLAIRARMKDKMVKEKKVAVGIKLGRDKNTTNSNSKVIGNQTLWCPVIERPFEYQNLVNAFSFIFWSRF